MQQLFRLTPTHDPFLCLLLDCRPVLKETQGHDDVELRVMRWGLVPSWFKGDLKDFKLSTINARLESLMEKPMFRTPLMKGQRCVVVVDGFFEWKTSAASKSSKQPFYVRFHRGGGASEEVKQTEPMMLAAIYDSWIDSNL
jgi:putative SOS response-associated peptidase YedK